MTGVSPLTGGLLSSNAGEYLSRNFVGTGHSVVEVTPESDELLAIHVTEEGVEFEEVPELVGADVREVTEAIFAEAYEDLLAIGDRVVNLERQFNNHRGVDSDDDVLPYSIPDLESSIQEYYEARGWTDDRTVPSELVSGATGAEAGAD